MHCATQYFYWPFMHFSEEVNLLLLLLLLSTLKMLLLLLIWPFIIITTVYILNIQNAEARVPLSKTWFNDHLNQVLNTCNLSPQHYSGHSFTIGTVTSAANKAISPSTIGSLVIFFLCLHLCRHQCWPH